MLSFMLDIQARQGIAGTDAAFVELKYVPSHSSIAPLKSQNCSVQITHIQAELI